MRTRYSPRARDDLKAILSYVQPHSSTGALNIRRAIRSCVDLIGRYPRLGRPAGEADVRVIPIGHYPYLVYWTILRGEVVILHIRHAKREPL